MHVENEIVRSFKDFAIISHLYEIVTVNSIAIIIETIVAIIVFLPYLSYESPRTYLLQLDILPA